MKQIIKSLIFFLSLMFLSSSAFSSVT